VAENSVETGFYASKDEFIEDAIETLLSARKDVKADIVCELYKKGDISIGKASEMLGKNIEEMKLELHGRGIKRITGDDIKNTKEMANVAIKFANPKTNK
jgi:predicted HTH domain antitoxin